MVSALCVADDSFEEEEEDEDEDEVPDDVDDLVVPVPLVVAFSPRESFRPGWISDGLPPMASRLSW